jgi:hypothetical protein
MAVHFAGGEAPVSNKLIPSGGRAFRDVNFLVNLGCDGCGRYATLAHTPGNKALLRGCAGRAASLAADATGGARHRKPETKIKPPSL